MPDKTKIPSQPFNRIALSLSGGGYRAAAFHLGSMAYLYKVQFKDNPLLENVRIISTVSGGTITGVLYAMMNEDGKAFPEIFEQTFRLLKEYDLVKEGLERLKKTEGWPPGKRRNIINAFAAIYNQHYTKGATFKKFEKMENTHLDEVVFNAIEFKSGIGFRFQNKGTFGNSNVFIPPKFKNTPPAAKEIKLGDIIAASSCFPGGFEPLAFPDDFIHEGAEQLKALKNTPEFEKPIGIMDGGIYDNQGITSILNSDKRHVRAMKKSIPKGERPDPDTHYYNLVIVSDVASPYMDGFKFSEPQKQEGARTYNYEKLKQLFKSKLGFASKILSILTIVSIIALFFGKGANNWLTGFGGLLLVLSLAGFFAISKIRKLVTNKLKDALQYCLDFIKGIDPFYLKPIKQMDFTKYTVGDFEPLIIDRGKSIMTMVNSVFLKQIRRLIYAKIYNDESWRYRRISNLILELTEKDFSLKLKGKQRWDGMADGKKLPPPGCDDCLTSDKDSVEDCIREILGDKIPAIAEEAGNFGTTLWFTPKDQLDDTLTKLVASGQFTMCYNLLIYLTVLINDPGNGFEELKNEEKTAVMKLYDEVLADWKAFKDEPFHMSKMYLENKKDILS